MLTPVPGGTAEEKEPDLQEQLDGEESSRVILRGSRSQTYFCCNGVINLVSRPPRQSQLFEVVRRANYVPRAPAAIEALQAP